MHRNHATLSAVVGILLLSSMACIVFGGPTPTPTTIPSPAADTRAPEPASTAEATATEPPVTKPTPTVTRQSSWPAGPQHFQDGQKIELTEIHMSTRDQGWGISGPFVFVTEDGGNHWREVTPPHPGLSPSDTLAYAAFEGPTAAWVVFSDGKQFPADITVWQTSTAGTSWTPSRPVYQEAYGDAMWAEFAVLDAQNVWLLMRGVYVGAGTHYNHELFQTADGGRSWTALPTEFSDDYTGLVFRDPLNGLRTLQTTGAYAEAPPAYEVTTDGGATWETRELPPPADAPDLFNQYPYCETYQPDLFSETFIRMLVGCFGYSFPPEEFVSYLYASFDNGKAWSIQLLPDKVYAPEETLLFFGAYPTLLLGRNMYQNSNGGFGEWTHVKTVAWDGQFSFVDASNGWAVATSGDETALVRTTDGGATWGEVDPRVTR